MIYDPLILFMALCSAIASHDLWLALCSEEALDTSGTGCLPLLYGRPLVEVDGITDALEYAVAVP